MGVCEALISALRRRDLRIAADVLGRIATAEPPLGWISGWVVEILGNSNPREFEAILRRAAVRCSDAKARGLAAERLIAAGLATPSEIDAFSARPGRRCEANDSTGARCARHTRRAHQDHRDRASARRLPGPQARVVASRAPQAHACAWRTLLSASTALVDLSCVPCVLIRRPPLVAPAEAPPSVRGGDRSATLQVQALAFGHVDGAHPCSCEQVQLLQRVAT